jgi:hypothetical protein
MPDRAPKVRRGEPRRASTFNRLRDFAASKLRLEVEPPLTLRPEGSGRVLSADQDRTLFVQLSGASSPYSMAQVRRRTSTHSWVTVAGGVACTACAYDLAGGTGLAGKVVEVWRGVGANDWLFQYNRYKPPCLSSICIKVTGCNGLPLAGATVTIKQGGVTIGSGTTGLDGKFCLGGLGAGTYTYQATKASFSGTPSGSLTIAAGPCFVHNATLALTTLADPTNYACSTCCAEPFPKVINLTDANGTHALNWNSPGAGFGAWTGCYALTAAGMKCDTPSGFGTPICHPATVTGYVFWSVEWCINGLVIGGGWSKGCIGRCPNGFWIDDDGNINYPDQAKKECYDLRLSERTLAECQPELGGLHYPDAQTTGTTSQEFCGTWSGTWTRVHHDILCGGNPHPPKDTVPNYLGDTVTISP